MPQKFSFSFRGIRPLSFMVGHWRRKERCAPRRRFCAVLGSFMWRTYFSFMIFIAEVSYTVARFNNPMYNDEMRVGDFLEEPHVAIVKALLLQFQPTFLDILPLYIVLLAAFPLILIGLRLSPLLVLIPSFACYLVVQISGLSVPAYPEGHVWFFNPLAWQFLFVIGAILGFGRTRPALPARLRTPAVGGGCGRCRRQFDRPDKLDDSRVLGRFSRPSAEGIVAGRQDQSVAYPSHSVSCLGWAYRGKHPADGSLLEFRRGQTLRPLRPLFARNLLSRDIAFGARAFRIVGI